MGIGFRISCKETSADRIEQQFAAPRWVMEAGARGGCYRMGKANGPESPWEPAFDDPVFLGKLDRFLAAFAARYDRQPWVRYVGIGSIGDWGEGHSWAGSRKECGFAARNRTTSSPERRGSPSLKENCPNAPTTKRRSASSSKPVGLRPARWQVPSA